MLKLRMTCGPYDRARALIDGRVRPEGIDLEVDVNPRNPGFKLKDDRGPFDAVEFYTGQYIADLPKRALGYTAIPIFVKRMFRHSYIYINKNAGIRGPADLNGKRIGLQNWFTSAGIWARGALEDDYGLDVKSVNWVAQFSDGNADWIPPDWLKLDHETETDQYELLATGRTDAALTTEVWAPDMHPDIDFLFPNYGEIEREYYERTRYFPIMHTLLIRTDLLDREPWVAMSLFEAWMESKRLCYEELEWQRVHQTALWYRELREEELAVGGEDFYRWGFRDTRFEIEKWLEYALRYGLISDACEPEALFHPSTLDT